MESLSANNYQSQRLKRRRGKRLVKFLISISIGVIGMYFLFNQFRIVNSSGSKEDATYPVTAQPTVTLKMVETSNTLEKAIASALEETKGTYGVVVKNLKTGETYSVNKNKTFEAGSLYKLWTMAVVINQLESGQLKENQILSQNASVLNNKFNIDPKLAEQTSGTVTFSVGNGLKQMISISANMPALLLTEKVKLSTIATFLTQNGFKESKVGTGSEAPETTPSDMALFFEKLYKGELANQEYTAKIIDLLKSQQLNDKLPKYLPEDTVVAHKTGEIGWFSHDAGIVYSPKGDYIIVILSESDSPAVAEDRIAQVSKAVYEYFEIQK